MCRLVWPHREQAPSHILICEYIQNVRGSLLPIAASSDHNLAIDTSVDLTKAITSLPITSSSSLTERVVITDVTMPDAVCTSISESTSPSTISLMVPLNWLRTLIALIVMSFFLQGTSELLRPTQLRRQR